jgi:hypothetical protein
VHHDLTDAVEGLRRFLGHLLLHLRIARLEERPYRLQEIETIDQE